MKTTKSKHKAGGTTRTNSATTTHSGADLPPEVLAARPTAPGTGNSTVYKDDPITGGVTEAILNDIVIRSPSRGENHIDSYMTAVKTAEFRQYPDRTPLYDIYAQILLDGYLFGVMQKRVLSVINQKIEYVDASGKEVDVITKLAESDDFLLTCRTILETQAWGISGMEFLPGHDLRLRVIPRKHIKPKTQLISIEQSSQSDGFDYTRLDNVWVIGDPEDLGYLNQCTPLVLYKRGAISDWANFIEIFGMPVRVVKYDPFDANAEAKLRQMIEEDGNLLAVMIPNTANFEIMDGKTSNASGELQHTFVKYFDDQVAIVVLGNTETTGNSGTGSQAKSKTHSDQQKEIIKADIKYLENKLNDPHFIKILQSYAWPVVEGGRFNIKSGLDLNQATQRITIETALAKAGLPIGEDHFYDTYDIPRPGTGERLIKPAMATPGEDPGLQLSDSSTPGTLLRLEGNPPPMSPEQVQNIIKNELKNFFA